MRAIERHDAEAVRLLLSTGSDANYVRFRDEDEPDGIIQPTTPLRLVMFRISDCLLDDEDLKQFGEIAKLLLQHGADPLPAMQIAEDRYGKYDPHAAPGALMNVWHIVARASLKS